MLTPREMSVMLSKAVVRFASRTETLLLRVARLLVRVSILALNDSRVAMVAYGGGVGGGGKRDEM